MQETLYKLECGLQVWTCDYLDTGLLISAPSPKITFQWTKKECNISTP